MMHIIVRTGSGRKFARRIGEELKRINRRNNWIMPSVGHFPTSFANRPHLNPRNTLIHSRAAYPDCGWMNNLVRKEEEGFRVINNTTVLRLTSNKFECAKHMYDAGLAHPKSWSCTHSDAQIGAVMSTIRREGLTKVVVKPYTSMEQGANVKVIDIEEEQTACTCPHCGDSHTRARVPDSIDLAGAIRSMPTSRVVIQEYVPYTAIYRVVVIGGRALPISWRDVPSGSRWRVSVCLNRNMEFVGRPDRELLRLAERTQISIGGEINFIDVFETRTGYVLSEINTACNLLLHEEKARQRGSAVWNIARYIAVYLDKEARRM